MFVTGVIVDFKGYAALLAPGYDVETNRRMREYRARATKEGLLYWHQRLLPKHFLPENVRYKLQPRKEPYKNIKKRLAEGQPVYIRGERIFERIQRGGVVNIVRGGGTERTARSAASIASYPTRAVLRMPVKGVIAAKPRDGKPDLREEITRTPESERDMIRVVIGVRFREELLRDAHFFETHIK